MRRLTRCALVTGVQTCALPISTGGVAHGLTGVGQNLVEEGSVLRRQLVGLLGLHPAGEASVAEVVLDVGPAALDEVLREPLAVTPVLVAGEIVGQVGEVGVEQREKAAERPLLAGVRRRSEEHTSELQSLM